MSNTKEYVLFNFSFFSSGILLIESIYLFFDKNLVVPVIMRKPNQPKNILNQSGKVIMFGFTFFYNAELRGRGFKTNNLCTIKIYVKTETFESRSVTPDPLQRDVVCRVRHTFLRVSL